MLRKKRMQYYKKIGTWLSSLFSTEGAVHISCLMMAFGLTTSPVLISLSIGLLTLTALVQISRLRLKYTSPDWYDVLPLLLFAGNVGWFFFTNNRASILTELRIKLPLFLFPLSFFFIPRPSYKITLQSLQLFIVVLSGVLIATLTNYLLNRETIDQLLLQSKAVPIITFSKDFSHIYFGVMAGFAVMGAWYLFTMQRQKYRYGWLMLGLFIFAGLHIISSRTGLVTVYSAIVAECLRWMWLKKNYVKGLMLFVLMGIGLMMAVNIVPALKNKLTNTIDDLNHYQRQEKLEHWSLARRIIVWQLSTGLIGRHPIVGVSPSDSKDSLSNLYEQYQYNIPEKDRITDPHNQYLQYGVDIGIGGMLILLTIIFYPMIKFGKDIHPLLLSFLMVSGVGMLFESLLERQYGVSFFMYFWSLLAVSSNFQTLQRKY